MVKHSWITKMRRQLWEWQQECDSGAAINGAQMSPYERAKLQELLKEVGTWIDSNLH